MNDAPLPSGTHIAIDLDANNRFTIEAWRKRNPGQTPMPFGWGVCRHGHGLLDLPPLAERQARSLADRLNTPVPTTQNNGEAA